VLELRIILLVVGVLFVAGIAGFEWWRSRGTRLPTATVSRDDSPSDTSHRMVQPLPEISVVRENRVSVSDALPVIELGGAEREGAHGSGGISVSDEVAIDIPAEATGTQPRDRSEPYIGQDDEISEVRVFDEQPVLGPQLVLAWPPEKERRIVTLRILPKGQPRFAGRALRQAFGSAGFWHGPLDIYHLPDKHGQVILSAAALAQPGTFDPSIMDSQRFSGLNMFAVLPGPRPERETFDELVHAARSLAERLDGTITDQHGEELTSQRVARLRQSLDAPQQARASGEA
jgi:cell division protein ZipA